MSDAGAGQRAGIKLVASDGAIVGGGEPDVPASVEGDKFEMHCGDGVEAAGDLDDLSVDLLLTDPPYGISSEYACETQVQRRPRPDGRGFNMPKGRFGEWDESDPEAWVNAVLPKVRGWAVTFCAQQQIGEYCALFEAHGLISVLPMVWHKTNPVPFNHNKKPVNAWEALVVGKRPGAPFNGHAVHNVFVCESPMPRQRIHSTQKPLPLVAELVGLFSGYDDLVFDPFAGSSTTVVAACQKGRVALAYERDPLIFAAAAERLETMGLAHSVYEVPEAGTEVATGRLFSPIAANPNRG